VGEGGGLEGVVSGLEHLESEVVLLEGDEEAESKCAGKLFFNGDEDLEGHSANLRVIRHGIELVVCELDADYLSSKHELVSTARDKQLVVDLVDSGEDG